jgi:hypothetical protein
VLKRITTLPDMPGFRPPSRLSLGRASAAHPPRIDLGTAAEENARIVLEQRNLPTRSDTMRRKQICCCRPTEAAA